jgi:hypothetical protein
LIDLPSFEAILIAGLFTFVPELQEAQAYPLLAGGKLIDVLP